MDELKRSLNEAFRWLAEDAAHPTAEEIARALDGGGSAFAAGEIRAHLGWCDACRAVGAEYERFRAIPPANPGGDEAAWAAMRRRLPPAPQPNPAASWRWLPMAAALAIVAGPLATWQVMRSREPRVIERIVERPIEKTVARPLGATAAAIVDLYPLGTQQRSGGAAMAASSVPAAPVVTFILHQAEAAPVRILDSSGAVIANVTLRRIDGAYAIALGEELLQQRPLTIESGSLRYRVP